MARQAIEIDRPKLRAAASRNALRSTRGTPTLKSPICTSFSRFPGAMKAQPLGVIEIGQRGLRHRPSGNVPYPQLAQS